MVCIKVSLKCTNVMHILEVLKWRACFNFKHLIANDIAIIKAKNWCLASCDNCLKYALFLPSRAPVSVKHQAVLEHGLSYPHLSSVPCL